MTSRGGVRLARRLSPAQSPGEARGDSDCRVPGHWRAASHRTAMRISSDEPAGPPRASMERGFHPRGVGQSTRRAGPPHLPTGGQSPSIDGALVFWESTVRAPPIHVTQSRSRRAWASGGYFSSRHRSVHTYYCPSPRASRRIWRLPYVRLLPRPRRILSQSRPAWFGEP